MENVVNKVVLSGCGGRDAEIRIVGGNSKLARVNIAENESYRNSAGEEVKKTQWFSLTFWGAKADIAELKIKKGTRFTIEGNLPFVVLTNI